MDDGRRSASCNGTSVRCVVGVLGSDPSKDSMVAGLKTIWLAMVWARSAAGVARTSSRSLSFTTSSSVGAIMVNRLWANVALVEPKGLETATTTMPSWESVSKTVGNGLSRRLGGGTNSHSKFLSGPSGRATSDMMRLGAPGSRRRRAGRAERASRLKASPASHGAARCSSSTESEERNRTEEGLASSTMTRESEVRPNERHARKAV
mmetsp:Transcript_65342/g.142504  ORF Transcript_65342/g.142504 Transcript_65342/m.142504 type:complete len:207 (-) Transcript_65342:542-1162(-)